MGNSKHTLVLMAGLPGSGKTTLAKALSRTLHWHHIYKDGFREDFIKQGLESETAGYWAYEQAFETVYKVLTESQASVILDSSARQKFVLEKALNIVRSVPNARLKVIFCVAERGVLIRHLAERDAQTNGQPQEAKTSDYSDTIDDYLHLFKHLPLDKLTLYTDGSLEDCLEVAKDYLMS